MFILYYMNSIWALWALSKYMSMSDMTYSQVWWYTQHMWPIPIWWPILGIRALHLPIQVHTHTHTHKHTQSSGQPFMLRHPGSSWGFGALLSHTHTHTRSSGQPFMLRHPGSSWGFNALHKGITSWYWRWREHCAFTPLTNNPCRTETRTAPHNFSITSPTFYH